MLMIISQYISYFPQVPNSPMSSLATPTPRKEIALRVPHFATSFFRRVIRVKFNFFLLSENWLKNLKYIPIVIGADYQTTYVLLYIEATDRHGALEQIGGHHFCLEYFFSFSFKCFSFVAIKGMVKECLKLIYLNL